MVDLKGQYAQIKDVVNASIQEVIETTAFINGPKVHEFQRNLETYLGVKHVIPCANGTDALQIAMMGGMPYTALRDAIFAHPTKAEALNNLFTSFRDGGE